MTDPAAGASPPAAAPPAAAPPAAAPPTGSPPAGSPPTGSPPATAPPAGSPPAASGPWWGSSDLRISGDADLTRFLEGKNYPDVGTALRSGMHADQVARDRAAWAKPDAENIGQWPHWKDLGWEADPAKYRLQRPEALKDAKDFDEGFLSALSKAAHERKIPVAMAQGLYEDAFKYVADMTTRGEAAEAAQLDAHRAALRQEWGDHYEERRAKAGMAMRALGVADAEAAQLEAALGVPTVAKLFDRLGGMLSEDQLVSHQGSAGAMTSWSAKAEMDRMRADPAFAASLADPRHPQHQANKDRWTKLSAATA